MAGKNPYLQRRGDVYRLRIRVPDDLRDLVKKREITKSLRTGNKREAQVAALMEHAKLEAEWTLLRRRRSRQLVSDLADSEIWRLVARWFVDAERKRGREDSTPDYQVAMDTPSARSPERNRGRQDRGERLLRAAGSEQPL